MKAIVIPYDNEPYTVDYPDDMKVMEYNELRYLMSHLPNPFSWFEIVRIQIGDTQCQMYVDEEGKMDGLWMTRINDIASEMYANPFDCIVGDVILLADKHDADSYLFTDQEAIDILDIIGE